MTATLLVAGVLASAHCVGMCGGFVLAAAPPGRRFAPRLTAQLAFLVGKTVTYVLLGALVGVAAGALVRSGWIGAVQAVLAVVAGVCLVWAGLSIAGLVPRLPLSPLTGERSLYGRAVRAVANARGPAVPFTLGALAGLLPCPLVYGFLAAALATGSLLGAVGTMALLGLASAPALLAVGALGAIASATTRHRLVRAGGIVVVLTGVLTLLRGLAPEALHAIFGHGIVP